jgi:hypothetical protein
MGGTTLKTLGIVAALIAVPVYLVYGTLSPCGALRESVRNQDGLARILPDGVVDAMIQANTGPLSPGRCLALLIGGQQAPAPAMAAAPVAAPPVPAPQPISAQTNSPAMVAAGNEAVTAINECRAKRLAGELKTYVESVRCSNPRIVQAYTRANYRYMDLIALFTAKRMLVSERLDRKQISEVDAGVENQQAFADIVTEEKARDAMRK